jgi:hypothetical protein
MQPQFLPGFSSGFSAGSQVTGGVWWHPSNGGNTRANRSKEDRR